MKEKIVSLSVIQDFQHANHCISADATQQQIETQIHLQINVFVAKWSTVIDADLLCAIWKHAYIFSSAEWEKMSMFINTWRYSMLCMRMKLKCWKLFQKLLWIKLSQLLDYNLKTISKCSIAYKYCILRWNESCCSWTLHSNSFYLSNENGNNQPNLSQSKSVSFSLTRNSLHLLGYVI